MEMLLSGSPLCHWVGTKTWVRILLRMLLLNAIGMIVSIFLAIVRVVVVKIPPGRRPMLYLTVRWQRQSWLGPPLVMRLW